MATQVSLLNFILSLLSDLGLRQQFQADPAKVLSDHGFDGVCLADVHDAMPLVADHVQQGSFHGGGSPVNYTPPADPAPGHGGNGESPMDSAIQQIHYITTTYTDSHDTTIDNSINQNIWAHGDVFQHLDNHPVSVIGDHGMAIGGDVKDSTVVHGDDNLLGTGNVVGDGNHDVTTTGDIQARDGSAVSIGSNGATSGSADDNSTHTTTNAWNFGSGNQAVAGNGGAGVTDNDGNTTVTDSNNDNHTDVGSHNQTTTNTDNSIHDSFDQTTTDNSVHDSGNFTSHNHTDIDLFSHNDTSIDSHDITENGLLNVVDNDLLDVL
ncbi:hypothetical protein D5S17_24040 [Pseudonocardiaceae bacterium YIM PH 21723]|nr:hypothetical protein D5S17_24040 [Pseudonocardiaceae bacterium YIM PH 21723]